MFVLDSLRRSSGFRGELNCFTAFISRPLPGVKAVFYGGSMKWFKHSGSAMREAAIERLIMEFGIEGYGLYFACIEIIVGNLDSDNITFELEHDAELIANKFRMDTLKVERIMHRCIELGLFELADSGRISCLKIARMVDGTFSKNAQIKKICASPEFLQAKIHGDNGNSEQIRLDEIRLDNISNKKQAIPEHTDNSTVEEFEKVWSEYPNKKGRTASLGYYKRLRKTYSFDDLLSCVKNYANSVADRDQNYIKTGSNFFSPKIGYFVDYLPGEMDKKGVAPKMYCVSCGQELNGTDFDTSSGQCWECYRREG